MRFDASSHATAEKPTFDVDVSLPGVQALLRVVLTIELELRRR